MGCNCGSGRAARIAAAAQAKIDNQQAAVQTASASITPADMGQNTTTTKETS